MNECTFRFEVFHVRKRTINYYNKCKTLYNWLMCTNKTNRLHRVSCGDIIVWPKAEGNERRQLNEHNAFATNGRLAVGKIQLLNEA